MSKESKTKEKKTSDKSKKKKPNRIVILTQALGVGASERETLRARYLTAE